METRETKDEIQSIKVRTDRLISGIRLMRDLQKDTNKLLKEQTKIMKDLRIELTKMKNILHAK